jgi:hypothetical protein
MYPNQKRWITGNILAGLKARATGNGTQTWTHARKPATTSKVTSRVSREMIAKCGESRREHKRLLYKMPLDYIFKVRASMTERKKLSCLATFSDMMCF